MAEESFPFQELAEGDRTVSAAMFAKHLGYIRTRGVIHGVDDALAVRASSPEAMSVELGAGGAFVGLTQLRAYRNTLPRTLVVDPADAAHARHDLVVLDMNTSSGPPDTRRVTATIVPGVAAADPADPALVQTETHYQLALARIVVPAGGRGIGAGALTDLREYSGPANSGDGGGFATRVKTSDESVRSSTTLQDDDDLSFTADANSVYFVIAGSLGEGARAGGLKFGWNLPAAAELHGWRGGWGNNLAAFNGNSSLVDPALGASYAQWTGPGNGAGDRALQHLFLGFLVTGGTGGTVARRFAQVTAHTTPSKHLAGSFLLYMKLT
jgi:hypothetical protein